MDKVVIKVQRYSDSLKDLTQKEYPVAMTVLPLRSANWPKDLADTLSYVESAIKRIGMDYADEELVKKDV